MEILNNSIQVTYLGRVPFKEDELSLFMSRNEYNVKRKFPMDIYKMFLMIDGKKVEFFFSTQKEYTIRQNKMKNKTPHNVINFYNFFIEGEEETEAYKKFEEWTKSLIQDSEVGKAGEIINFDLADSTIDTRIPDINSEYEEIENKIMEQLSNEKRQRVIDARKESLNMRYPDLQERFNKKISQLNELEKKKIIELYKMMIICLLNGKYCLNDLVFFIENIEKIAKSEGIFYTKNNSLQMGSRLTPFHNLSKEKINGITSEGLDVKYNYTGERLDPSSLRVLDIHSENSYLSFLHSEKCKGKLKDRYGIEDYNEDSYRALSINSESVRDAFRKKPQNIDSQMPIIVKIYENGDALLINGKQLEEILLLEHRMEEER